jgi:hypothetical protein
MVTWIFAGDSTGRVTLAAARATVVLTANRA